MARSTPAVLVLAMSIACVGDDPPPPTPSVPKTDAQYERKAGASGRVAEGTPSSPLRRPVVVVPEHGYELAIQGTRLVESLGFAGADGEFVPILNSGAELPAIARESFSTIDDNQAVIELHLLGANEEARTLGTLEIVDIPAAPRGVPVFEIAFDVSEQGRIGIEVKDADNGARQVFIARWGEEPRGAFVEARTPICPGVHVEVREAIEEIRRAKAKKDRRRKGRPEPVPESFDSHLRLREDLGLDDAHIRQILIRLLELEPDFPIDVIDFVTIQDLADECCPRAEAPE